MPTEVSSPAPKGDVENDIIIPQNPDAVKSDFSLHKKTSTNSETKFSLMKPVEETKDLIAVHNISPAKLLKTLKLGGFPMPSIAVAGASDGFNQFGEISIVFDKNTIDPQTSADNKIYGSDAWTPVYPGVEYEIDMDKAVGIYSRARKAGHLTFFNPVYLHQDAVENDINRYKGENGLVEHYKDDYGMKQFYLSETGKSVDMVIGERTEALSEQEIEQAEFIAKELGKETILKIKTDSYTAQQWMQEYGQLYKDALFKYYRGRAKETVTDEQIWDIIDSKKAFQHSSDVQGIKNYLENGAVRTETFEDARATREKIDDLVNREEYEKWLTDLFKGVVIKSGIRNNVDPYTETGDRKSFDETHYAETLENVVRAMKEEEKQAGNSMIFSGTGLWGTAAKRYGSIDEVKSDSGRLVAWSEEKFSEVKRAIGSKLSDLADRIKSTTEPNEFIARDNAITCILETISEAKNRSEMLKQLKSYYGLNQKAIDENVVQEIIDIVAEVQAMPTDYFEAKPQRAVGINEVKAVIMPSQESYEDDLSEVKAEFEKFNVPVLEYEYGDNNARIKALNSVENVQFSLMKTDSTSSKDTKALLETIEHLKNEAEGESYSLMKAHITTDMSDEERYNILVNKSITDVPKVNAKKLSIMGSKLTMPIDEIYRLKETERKKLFVKIGEEFGIFKNYTNEDIELDFEFSKGGMRESEQHQNGNYETFAKLFSCFDEVIERAIGIEVHNRNNEGYKVDVSLKEMYVLVSAFEDGENIIPVKLEIKEFDDKENKLYIAVALESIKKNEVVKEGNTNNSVTQTSRSFNISLSQLLKNVKDLSDYSLKGATRSPSQRSSDILNAVADLYQYLANGEDGHTAVWDEVVLHLQSQRVR